MSSIAQDEVRKLSERTRFGFKRAQENSVLLGQNNLFGYNKVDGRLRLSSRKPPSSVRCSSATLPETSVSRAITNDLTAAVYVVDGRASRSPTPRCTA